jgi:citrate synthase
MSKGRGSLSPASQVCPMHAEATVAAYRASPELHSEVHTRCSDVCEKYPPALRPMTAGEHETSCRRASEHAMLKPTGIEALEKSWAASAAVMKT